MVDELQPRLIRLNANLDNAVRIENLDIHLYLFKARGARPSFDIMNVVHDWSVQYLELAKAAWHVHDVTMRWCFPFR